jgi:Ricin-type beta-trefoil lectin domain
MVRAPRDDAKENIAMNVRNSSFALSFLSLSALVAACAEPHPGGDDDTSNGAGTGQPEVGTSVAEVTAGGGVLLRPDVNNRSTCLDGAGGVEFARPYLRACDGNNVNLHWTLTQRFDGQLKSEVNPGLCVDAAGGGEGLQVYLRACDNNNANLRWSFRADGQLSPKVNGNVCLDAAGGGEGAVPYLRACDGNNPNLRWSFNTQWRFTTNSCSTVQPAGATNVNSFPRCLVSEPGFSSTGFSCGSGFPSTTRFNNYICAAE